MCLFLEFERLILISSHDEFGSYVLSLLKIVIIQSSRYKIACSKRQKKKKIAYIKIMFIHIEYSLLDTLILQWSTRDITLQNDTGVVFINNLLAFYGYVS